MRHINIQKLAAQPNWPSPAWHKRWHEAEAELRNLPAGKKRSDIFDKYSDVWSMLKEDFRVLSCGKCWYCEVNMDAALGDIDHYRPKGKVVEDSAHPGYWWLAFDWHNFRYSCEKCNRNSTDYESGTVGGKKDHFPLVDERCRIRKECAYKDLLQETPMLLDPTEPGDPILLSFQPDGCLGPASKDKKSIEYKRAAKSIEIYHLNRGIANRRRRDLYRKVHSLVDRCQTYQLLRLKNPNDLAAKIAHTDAVAELRSLMAVEAEYSAAAKIYVGMYRKAKPAWAWVDRLILDAS